MQLAEAFIKLKIDSGGAKGKVRDEARSVAEEMTSTFAKFFSAAVVIKGLSDATQAASRLEQAVGGTEAIFGSATAIIEQFAETSAESLGLSESAFREVTSQIGGLLNGLGFTQAESAKTSIELTQLGADLAATFGGKPEEAVQALGAALRGEFNPLERFGVSLRVSQINLKAVELGLASSTTEVDGNARAQAALALITEQSAQAVGQFGREEDTAAGQTARLAASFENAKAKLGEQLLPAFVTGVQLLGDLLDGFTELPGPVQAAVVAMVGIAAVASPVSNAVSALSSLTKAITSTQLKAAGTAAAIGLLVLAYNEFTRESREAKARQEEVSSALANGVGRLKEYADAAAETASELDDLAVASSALNDALLEGDGGEELRQALGALGLQGEDALGLLIDLSGDAAGAMAELARESGATEEQIRALLVPYQELGEGGAVGQVEAITDATATLTPELQVLADAFVVVNTESNRLDLNTMAQEFLNFQFQANDATAALIEQAEATSGASRNGEQAYLLYQEYGRVLAQTDQATRDAALGNGDLADSAVEASAAIEKEAAELREVEAGALEEPRQRSTISTRRAPP